MLALAVSANSGVIVVSVAGYLTHSMSFGLPTTVLQGVAGTQPDLHLIKLVKQVARLALELLPRHLAGSSSVGITAAVNILVFLSEQLLDWLLSGCKNSENGHVVSA
jgi:hypothetical protein